MTQPEPQIRDVPATEAAPRRPRRTRDEAEPADEALYTPAEHQVAAARGAYGERVRPEHVAGAWVARYPDLARVSRAEMVEALDEFRRTPA